MTRTNDAALLVARLALAALFLPSESEAFKSRRLHCDAGREGGAVSGLARALGAAAETVGPVALILGVAPRLTAVLLIGFTVVASSATASGLSRTCPRRPSRGRSSSRTWRSWVVCCSISSAGLGGSAFRAFFADVRHVRALRRAPSASDADCGAGVDVGSAAFRSVRPPEEQDPERAPSARTPTDLRARRQGASPHAGGVPPRWRRGARREARGTPQTERTGHAPRLRFS